MCYSGLLDFPLGKITRQSAAETRGFPFLFCFKLLGFKSGLWARNIRLGKKETVWWGIGPCGVGTELPILLLLRLYPLKPKEKAPALLNGHTRNLKYFSA